MSKSLLLFSFGLGVILHWIYLPRLPEQVFCHFNLSGNPSGFMMTAFVFTLFSNLIFFIVTGSILMGIYFVRKGKTEWINLPNKKYWFEENRKSNTIRFLDEWMSILGVITNLLLIFIFYSIYIANLSNPVKISNWSIWSIGCYIFLMTLGSLYFYFKFENIEDDSL